MFPKRGPQKSSQLGIVHPDAAGIDVHSESSVACTPVPQGSSRGAMMATLEIVTHVERHCGWQALSLRRAWGLIGNAREPRIGESADSPSVRDAFFALPTDPVSVVA